MGQQLVPQLLKSYLEHLQDMERCVTNMYGPIIGITILGEAAARSVLAPVIRGRLKQFSEKCACAESGEEIMQMAWLRSALVRASALLFKPKMFLNVDGSNDSSTEQRFTHNELSEELGENLSVFCSRANHEPILVNGAGGSKLPPLVKLNNSRSNERSSAQLLLPKLEQKRSIRQDGDSLADTDSLLHLGNESTTSKIIINGMTTNFKRICKKPTMPLQVFEDSDKDVEDSCDIPHKKRKQNLSQETIKLKGIHSSYRHNHRRVKDFSNISNHL